MHRNASAWASTLTLPVSCSQMQNLSPEVGGTSALPERNALDLPGSCGRWAYPESEDQYLVIWQDAGSSGDIEGQRVSPSGTLVGSAVAPATGANAQQAPSVAYSEDAGEWLVVWEEQVSGDWELRMRRVASDGDLQAIWTVVDQNDDQRRPALSGSEPDGDHFLVWQDERNNESAPDIYGQRYEPLLAGISATPTAGAMPLATSFSDSSTPTGSGDQWLWDFGDGATSTLEDPTHTYTATGLYTVTQTVTDTDTGEWATTTVNRAVLVGRTITYTYDALNRLTGAAYSTGEAYGYQYDAGNHKPVAWAIASPSPRPRPWHRPPSPPTPTTTPTVLPASSFQEPVSSTPGTTAATSPTTASSLTPTTQPGGWCARRV